ncbi:hypothetical protein NEN86_00965 [Escherichia coli]|nr:inner membrane protein YiaB [Escherichia coli]MBF2849882.1 hypothetical protein [Escherichia coli]MBF2859418.1 hypothetical protein [Escherichia coli]MDI1054497.1 hypothetical protein [Escherichia coli]
MKTITYLSDTGCLEIQGASLVGLWISCPLLSGKGYFLGVLMTATFGNYAYLRAEKLGQLDDFFTHICQLVALITIGLLFIGVLNAPINTYEMVIYPIAFFVCLFGQMRLFRSA